MVVADWGTLDGPVCLFGGPYSNRQATNAMLAQAGDAALVCTGDVVAYCAAPSETVALIRGSGAHVIAGNCERQLAAGAGDCGCGFEDGSACDLLSVRWYAHADAHVGADDRAWMGALPDLATFRHQGLRYGVLHGGARDVARFIWSVSDGAVFDAEWQAFEAAAGPVDRIIAGHSGLPFQRETERGTWINAGVIGMPPHDGRSQTAYAMLDRGQIAFHRLDYDVAGAQAEMAAAGLTQGYDRALASGYWPSEDVLPASLRRSSSVASG